MSQWDAFESQWDILRGRKEKGHILTQENIYRYKAENEGIWDENNRLGDNFDNIRRYDMGSNGRFFRRREPATKTYHFDISLIKGKVTATLQAEVITIRIYQVSELTYPLCPHCSAPIEREYSNYCPNCGQGLLWNVFCEGKCKCERIGDEEKEIAAIC